MQCKLYYMLQINPVIWLIYPVRGEEQTQDLFEPIPNICQSRTVFFTSPLCIAALSIQLVINEFTQRQSYL